jgi:hypothetical protein
MVASLAVNIKKPLVINAQGSKPPSSPAPSSPAATTAPPEGSKPPGDEVY